MDDICIVETGETAPPAETDGGVDATGSLGTACSAAREQYVGGRPAPWRSETAGAVMAFMTLMTLFYGLLWVLP